MQCSVEKSGRIKDRTRPVDNITSITYATPYEAKRGPSYPQHKGLTAVLAVQISKRDMSYKTSSPLPYAYPNHPKPR